MREYLPDGHEWTAGIIWALAAILLVLVVVAMIAGCEPIRIESQPPARPAPIERPDCPDGRCPYEAGPINRLETALRHPNYAGGSCAHAGMQDALIAQGMEWTARLWRQRYRGGAGASTLRAICENLNLRYAYTTAGEVEFLEWCSRTRRPACIFYFSGHAITFLGFDRGRAILYDNNRTEKEIAVPKAEFLRKWDAYGRSYGHRGGVAFTVVYTPAAPPPRLLATQYSFP